MKFDFAPGERQPGAGGIKVDRTELKKKWDLETSAKINGARIMEVLTYSDCTNQFVVPYVPGLRNGQEPQHLACY